MKVLQINSVCGIRSTGRICTDISEVLIADGHDCITYEVKRFINNTNYKYYISITKENDER